MHLPITLDEEKSILVIQAYKIYQVEYAIKHSVLIWLALSYLALLDQ